MIKTLICLSLILLPLISAEGGIVSVWKTVDALAPEIELIARFAVDEHNKQSKEVLEFVKVVQAKVQTVVDTIYNLIIEAKNGADGPDENFEAVVIIHENNKALISFEVAA
ncbi:unnamed protein product [Eruca vesicaria subsp. sativa]|uniref:Cystatin domain-containing protein n=1 Tax=Eruca vesicaria subsp. sativa TaxID=29727 RepID=A0ABC8KY03_ERUVS|nr:unnamed protein product [Eruca vesicaria subsp. sativa]